MDYSILDNLEPKAQCEILSVVRRLTDLQIENGIVTQGELMACTRELVDEHRDIAWQLFGQWLVSSAQASIQDAKELAILGAAEAMSLTSEGKRILREIVNS